MHRKNLGEWTGPNQRGKLKLLLQGGPFPLRPKAPSISHTLMRMMFASQSAERGGDRNETMGPRIAH